MLKSRKRFDVNRKIDEYFIINKSGLFDPSYYRQYKDVRLEKVDPLMHFIAVGWKEGRNPSDEFNTNYYFEFSQMFKKPE